MDGTSPAELLRAARAKRGLNQKEAAALMGVPQNTLSRWEKPTGKGLGRWAAVTAGAFYGIDPNLLTVPVHAVRAAERSRGTWDDARAALTGLLDDLDEEELRTVALLARGLRSIRADRLAGALPQVAPSGEAPDNPPHRADPR